MAELLSGFFEGILDWIVSILYVVLMPVGTFILGLLPDGDPQVMGAIDSLGGVLGVGVNTSFNVLYFVDLSIVAGFVQMASIMLLAYLVYWLVRNVISLVTKVADAIPVVG